MPAMRTAFLLPQRGRLLHPDQHPLFFFLVIHACHPPGLTQRQYLLKHFFGNHPPFHPAFPLHSTLLSITNVEEAKWMEGRALIAAILFNDDLNAWSSLEITNSVPEGTNELAVSVRADRKSNYPLIGFSNFPTISLRKQQDGSWKIELSQDILDAAKSDAGRIEEK